MQLFRILRSTIRASRGGLAREFVNDLVQDQVKERVFGFKNINYTGLPTKGGALYSLVKSTFGAVAPEQKQNLIHELMSNGISREGAEGLVSGKDSMSPSDLTTLVRLMNKAEAESSVNGGVYVAAMMDSKKQAAEF